MHIERERERGGGGGSIKVAYQTGGYTKAPSVWRNYSNVLSSETPHITL